MLIKFGCNCNRGGCGGLALLPLQACRSKGCEVGYAQLWVKTPTIAAACWCGLLPSLILCRTQFC